MKFLTCSLLILIFCVHTFAQKNRPDPQYKLISGGNYVKSKNYYLLTLFNEIPGIKKQLLNDPVLMKFAETKRQDIANAVKNCGKDLGCYIKAVKFSDQEINRVGIRLGELYKAGNELGEMVRKHLIASGCYQLHAQSDDKQMLIKSWEQDARAINYTIDIYTAGNKPSYAQIDSISFNIKDPAYAEMVALNADLSIRQTKSDASFYAPVLMFALQSLEINERNRAGDDEPMEETVNKAAWDYSKKIKWDQYQYTLILVPGEGPEEKDTEISGGGMLRCRLAVLQYKAGLAPFIMVSGGCVHPFKTRYNEAAEMKKYLTEVLHIPEYAILMEPHARHTTTNLRNCARIIFRLGFPMDKPCITSTARSQSLYITGTMPGRCEKELGYVPYTNGKRLSDTEAEFYPLAVSLQIDFDEPMDP